MNTNVVKHFESKHPSTESISKTRLLQIVIFSMNVVVEHARKDNQNSNEDKSTQIYISLVF